MGKIESFCSLYLLCDAILSCSEQKAKDESIMGLWEPATLWQMDSWKLRWPQHRLCPHQRVQSHGGWTWKAGLDVGNRDPSTAPSKAKWCARFRGCSGSPVRSSRRWRQRWDGGVGPRDPQKRQGQGWRSWLPCKIAGVRNDSLDLSRNEVLTHGQEWKNAPGEGRQGQKVH